MINEEKVKQNLFNFIKENSNFGTYKKAVKILSENQLNSINVKLNNNVVLIKTDNYFVNIDLISGNIEYNCNEHNSFFCEHIISIILYFISNYSFDYHNFSKTSISPLSLLENKWNSGINTVALIEKNFLQYAEVTFNKSGYYYLKKLLHKEDITKEKIEEIINIQKFSSNPKFFVQKGKRSVVPLKIDNNFAKIYFSIERLNDYFVKIFPYFEDNINLLYIFNGFYKKVLVYNNGVVKIFPPKISMNKLEAFLSSPQIISITDLNSFIFSENSFFDINILVDKNKIEGFNIIDEEPEINIFLDTFNEYLKVKVELKYNSFTLNLLNKERIIDNNIIFRNKEEFELLELFKNLNATIEKDFFTLDSKNSLKFIFKIISEEFSKYNIFGEEKLTRFKIHRPITTSSLKVFSYKEWFEIDGGLSFDEKKVGISELVKNIKEGKNYVKIKKNHYGIIPENYIRQIKNLIDDASFWIDKKRDKLKIFKLESLNKKFLLENLDNYDTVVKELEKIKDNLKNFKSIKSYKIPENFSKFLRDYQKDGVRWLLFLKDFHLNGILADEMGLGKTIQALTLLKLIKTNETNLVIVPTSLLYNWENEINKFAYNFNYLILYGKNRENLYKQIKNYNLILTTYNIVRLDFDILKDIDFHYIILDESQFIKNPASIISKYIKNLKSKHRLSITGTPFENSLTDIWSQFEFLHPGLLGSLKEFQKKYSNNTRKLQNKIAPLILRRKKDEVIAELPPKTEIKYYYEMNPQQQELYNSIKAFYIEKIENSIKINGINQSRMLIIEGLLRLRQICCHPKLTQFEHIKYKNIKSEKFENLKKLIDDFIKKDTKTVIYSQFVKMLKIIKRYLRTKNIDFEYLDGATKKRLDKINNFQKNNNIKLFLISTKAGGLGINLTSAENVVIYDPWWNPSVENQAIDRIHRIGQEKKVFAYKLIMKNSVEEKILKLQAKKNSIAEELFKEESIISNFTKEDIEYIFR